MLSLGNAGHVGEQRFADSMLSEFRADKDIFEKQSRTALESRIKFKEHGISSRLPTPLRNEGAEFGGGAETVASDVVLGQIHFVAQALELREFVNHRREQRRISNGGRANRKHRQTPG